MESDRFLAEGNVGSGRCIEFPHVPHKPTAGSGVLCIVLHGTLPPGKILQTGCRPPSVSSPNS